MPSAVDTTAPNTVTEDVPAHIAAGEDLARSIDDTAETFGVSLVEAVQRHIASMEGMRGFPPSLQGGWVDNVKGPLDVAMAALQSAAEGARGLAAAERDALMPSVEAASSAPADSDLSHSDLRVS